MTEIIDMAKYIKDKAAANEQQIQVLEVHFKSPLTDKEKMVIESHLYFLETIIKDCRNRNLCVTEVLRDKDGFKRDKDGFKEMMERLIKMKKDKYNDNDKH